MARLPGMIKVTDRQIDGNKMIIKYRVRWWHPSAWRMMWEVMQKFKLTRGQQVRIFGSVAMAAVRSIFRFR